ncbi:hypothetical protein NI389_02690 [Pseudoalteromonas xiamenensis]|nr:hypothetical protein [Pseudoalteromonas xiamenensis]WMN60338.1 hypothetical protein NI389_02690 [Pseudoalteromonas xiamenensis]
MLLRLKLNKKNVKNLLGNKKTLPIKQTPAIGGGTDISMDGNCSTVHTK